MSGTGQMFICESVLKLRMKYGGADCSCSVSDGGGAVGGLCGLGLSRHRTACRRSGTGDILKISENCKVRAQADGRGTLIYHYTKRGSSSVAYYEGDVSHSFWGMLPFPNRTTSI